MAPPAGQEEGPPGGACLVLGEPLVSVRQRGGVALVARGGALQGVRDREAGPGVSPATPRRPGLAGLGHNRSAAGWASAQLLRVS